MSTGRHAIPRPHRLPEAPGSPSGEAGPSPASGPPCPPARGRFLRRRLPTASRREARTALVVLERPRDVGVRAPVVRVQACGLFVQLLAAVLVLRPAVDAGQDVGVPRPEPRQALGPEACVGRARRLVWRGRHGLGRAGRRCGGGTFPFGSARRRRWRLRRDGFLFAIEDLRPVEADLRVVRFDQPDGLLVDRRAADADTWRRPEPIEDPWTGARPPARGMDDVGVLVSTLVACDAQRRQRLFPFLRARRRCLWSGRAFGARGFGGPARSSRPCVSEARVRGVSWPLAREADRRFAPRAGAGRPCAARGPAPDARA